MKNLCSRLYEGRGDRGALCAGLMVVEELERRSASRPDLSEAFVVLAMQEPSSFLRDETGVLTLVAFTRIPS